MRLRNTFVLVLSGASAIAAIGCGGSDSGGEDRDGGGSMGEGDSAVPSECEGQSCEDAGAGSQDASTPSCRDGVQNGDESDIDCGGDCDACEGDACSAGSECASGVCTAGGCVAERCDDNVRNGDEGGVDCGGSCSQSCDAPTTCQGECQPPTAGFTLVSSGTSTVTATSSALPGSASVVQTRYDWGDGTGSGTAASHDYGYAGAYTVTQTVIDADGRMVTASQALTVTGGFVPVRFSSTDMLIPLNSQTGMTEPGVRLHDNGFTVEARGMRAVAVRTDASIAPGAGVFYFETERLYADETSNFWGFGVASPDAPLEPVMGPTALGTNNQSFGVYSQGTVATNAYSGNGIACAGIPPSQGVSISPDNRHVGYVIDYRGPNPIVHIVAREFPDTPSTVGVRCSATLTAISKPVFGMFAGLRTLLGPRGRINTGADTQNFPFFYSQAEVAAALDAATGNNQASSVLVRGFGNTHARSPSAVPSLVLPDAVTVALGSPVTLAASANDADEGDITNKIEWVERPTAYDSPLRGYGSSYTFTPTTPGKHKVQLSVTDATGQRATGEVIVSVTGTLPAVDSVRFDTQASHGQRALVTDDGLGVYFQVDGRFKDGVRANRGLIGDFWYFEATRGAGSYDSMGIGLVTADAQLDPYSTYATPWSMSINVTSGVWRDLIYRGALVPDSAMGDFQAGTALTRYGFAVDYRGDYPIVHVIVGAGSSGRLVKSVPMPDVRGPVYPFVYSGDGQLGSASTPAVTLDFQAPFGFDVRAALQATPSVSSDGPLSASDAAALTLGWGSAP